MTVFELIKKFTPKSEETFSEFATRICTIKCSDNNEVGFWDDVKDILNYYSGRKSSESFWRKRFLSGIGFEELEFDYSHGYYEKEDSFDDSQNGKILSLYNKEETHPTELIVNTDESLMNKYVIAQKEILRLRDRLNDANKSIRDSSRNDFYYEEFIDAVKKYQCKQLDYHKDRKFTGVFHGDNDLVISFTDVHCGSMPDENLKRRINNYLDKIFEAKLCHSAENVYVNISELISGLIHSTLRIKANKNVIQQFLTATDYLSLFLTELSYQFNDVYVSVCYGNHSRLFENKEVNLRGENFDALIIPFLKAKLQNIKNIYYIENDLDETMSVYSVRGNTVVNVHGDLDSTTNIIDKLTIFLKKQIDICMVGHRHTNALYTQSDSKVIQAGSFVYNEDDYAKNKRLRNRPEQVIAVVNSDGLECLYDVKLQ